MQLSIVAKGSALMNQLMAQACWLDFCREYSRKYWQLALVILILLAALFWPVTGDSISLLSKNLAPSWQHPFGTDWLGRDMLARSLDSLIVSLYIGVSAVLLSGLLSLLLASLAQINRHWQTIIEFSIDLFMSLPHLLLLLLLSLAFGGQQFGLLMALVLSHWPKLTRLLIYEMKTTTHAPYYQLAQQFGHSRLSVMRRHLLPYIMPQLLMALLIMLPHALTHMAALTFLGFGLNPTEPSIGGLLAQANQYLLLGYWWLAVLPGVLLLGLLLLMWSFARQVNQNYRCAAAKVTG